MILRIRAIGLGVLLIAPIAFLVVPTRAGHGVPKVNETKNKPFPWQGQAFPLISSSAPDEGDERNRNWPEIARLLRARDTRFYAWDAAPEALDKEEILVRNWLLAAGYEVDKVVWRSPDYAGFRARRGAETLVGLWFANGLFWGHQVCATPAQKLNDELVKAIDEGAPTRVQKLLQRGANPRATDYMGDSMLLRAVESGNAESLRLLLQAQGKKRDQASEFGDALAVAAENDNAAAVTVFLKMGANSAQIGRALQATATRGAAKSARLLVSKAPLSDVEDTLITASYVDDWRGDTVQYPEIVKLMITRKPSQTALNQALARVCDADNSGIMDLLLAAGADPNTPRDGKPVLLWAACSHRNYTVEPLLRHGANSNIRSANGETALMAAASCYSAFSRDVADLLHYGAEPKMRDNKGQTALDRARANLAHAQSDGFLPERQKIVALLEAATQTAK